MKSITTASTRVDSLRVPARTRFRKFLLLALAACTGATVLAQTPTISTTNGIVASAPGNGREMYNGNTVTLNGTNLDAVTAVKVGGSSGMSATIGTKTANSLTFTLPAGARGYIYVQNATGSALSADTITNLGYITKADGSMGTAATWLGGAVPVLTSSTNVTIANNVSTSANLTIGALFVNAGMTLTISSGNILTVSWGGVNNGTITTAATSSNLTLTGGYLFNDGTISMQGTLMLNGATGLSGNSVTYGQTNSALTFSGNASGYSVSNTDPLWPSVNGPVSVTANSPLTLEAGFARTVANVSVNGATLTITDANALTVGTLLTLVNTAVIAGNAPVYGPSSTLNYAAGTFTVDGSHLAWAAGNSGAGVPYNVRMGGTVTLAANRTARNSFQISGGTFTNGSYVLDVATSVTTANTTAFSVSAGAFNVTGGAVNVGPAGGGNQGFTVSGGSFTIGGGTMTVNGNVNLASLTQTGGLLKVDGNGSTASVASGTALVTISSANPTLSGGTLLIVDPHAGSGASDYSFSYTGNGGTNFADAHTMQFGDGVSTASGGSKGFYFNVQGGRRITFGSMVVNNPSGTNRFVQPSGQFGVRGNLTINAGELLLPGTAGLVFGGNLVNNGVLTSIAPVATGLISNSANTAATATQTISGTGTFRNAQSGATASFTNLTFNNSNAAVPAITFNIGGVSASGVVTLTAGTVSTSNNDFTFTSTASTSGTAAYLIPGSAQVKKVFSGTGSFTYPIGETTGTAQNTPLTLNVSANSTSRTIGVALTDAAHPNLGAGGTPANYISRYWTLSDDATASISFTPTLTYNTTAGQDVVGTASSLGIASWNGSAWTDYVSTVSSPTIAATAAVTSASGLNGLDLSARSASATKLTVFSLTPTNPTAGVSFSATVYSLNASSNPTAVTAATTVTLSLPGYGGTLGGTITGTIPAGSSSVTISGITLSAAATGLQFTATASGGDALTAGQGAPFSVLAPASKLAFGIVPASGTTNTAFTVTVRALRPDNSVDDTYTGNITVATASGSGTLSGTTTVAAAAGVASFSTLKFNIADAYTLSASATGLTDAPASSSINIAYAPSSVDYFRSAQTGNWATPGTWQTSPDGLTNWTASTTLTPTYTSAGIEIQAGHTVTLSSSVTVDQLTINGILSLPSNAATLTLASATGDEVTVGNSGQLLVNTAAATYSSTFGPGSSATFRVKSGGLIKYSGTSNTFSTLATATGNTWEDGAVFEWNTFTAPLITSNYFPNADAATVPVLRITSSVSNITATTTWTLNGRLEANSNASFTGAGQKIFRNGITGTATVTQVASSGSFLINGATASLGGGTLSLGTGLTINSGTVATLTGNLATSGFNTIIINGTLNGGTKVISGSAYVTLGAGATLSTANPAGVPGTFTTTGTKTYSSAANYVLNGMGQNTGVFATTPDAHTVASLEIDGTVTNTYGSTLNVGSLVLTSGSLNLNSNALNVTGSLTRVGGVLDGATSAVSFTGASAQSVPASAFEGGVVKSLTIDNPGGVTLTGTDGLTITDAANGLTLTAGILDLGANDLTLAAGAISGGSPASYVKTSGAGALHLKTVSSATFPVGNSTYNPVALASGTTQGWSVRVEDAISNVTGIYAPNVAKAVSRQWFLTPDSANPVPVPGVAATFYYNGSNDVGPSFSNAMDVQVWHYDGTGGWAKRGDAVTPSVVNGLQAVSVSGLTYFSPFAISNIDAPLPVSLIRFTGKRTANVNELKWTTASESNNRGFAVERSTDGINFNQVSFVTSRAAGGNSTSDLSYSYSESISAGSKWYYRLKQEDLDGRSKYSAVVLLKGDKSGILTVDGIYPNPVKGATSIRLQASAQGGSVVLQLTDMQGRVVRQQSVLTEAGASTTVNLDLAGLAAGQYHLKAIAANGEASETMTLIKQ